MPYYQSNTNPSDKIYVGNPGLNPDLIAGRTNIGESVSNAIPVDNLNTPAPTPPKYTPPVDTTNYNAMVAGNVPPPPAPTPVATPETDKAKGLLASIEKALGLTSGKTAYVQQQDDLAGVTALNTRQKELAGQLTALNNEAQAKSLKSEDRLAPTFAIRGEQAQIERGRAVKSLSISSEYALNAGQLETAKANAQRAVDLKYKDEEDKIEKNTKLLALYAPFMSAEQTAKATEATRLNEEKKTELADKKKQQTDVINAAQEAAKNGDPIASGIAAEALRLDPNSSTFTKDLADLQTKIKATTDPSKILDLQYKQLQIAKLKQDLATSGVGGQDADTLIAYANQYASTGAIPTGLPKGTLGTIANLAKELPKTNGEIVDNNTNIRSGKLTSTQIDAYSALKDLSNKLDDAKVLFDDLHTGIIAGTIGSALPSQKKQAYDTLRGEITDLLARARTGAAISATEEALYKSKVPSTFNNTFFLGTSGDTKLSGLKSSIEGKLDAGLKANGVSMYGFSKIKLSDGKEYKVGEVINVNGHQGRVNPDGTITAIN